MSLLLSVLFVVKVLLSLFLFWTLLCLICFWSVLFLFWFVLFGYFYHFHFILFFVRGGGGGDVSCFIRISVSTTTIIYAKQENQSFVCLQTLNIFECINMWEKVLCELSCDTKEETMSVYTRFWASVGFFHLITQFKLTGVSLRNSRFLLASSVRSG